MSAAALIERWTHQEIVDFLNICKEREILTRMTNRKYRFDEILADIRLDMDALGYSRTIHQMSIKFKKLRQRYNQCLAEDSNGKRLKRQFAFFKIMHEMEKDRLLQQSSDKNIPQFIEDVETEFESIENSPKEQKPFTKPNSIKREREKYAVEEEDPMPFQSGNISKRGKRDSPNNYTECFKMLVTSFKSAQEDLQQSFFKQQLILQQQQQEWEEKILDEEREFFAKILNSSKSQHF